MNITVKKVIKKLESDHEWSNLLKKNETSWFIEELIKDTLSVVDDILLSEKGISIKKKKTKNNGGGYIGEALNSI